NLVSGSGTYNGRFDEFSDKLNASDDSDTWVDYCGTDEGAIGTYPGCNGVNAMHNKFFLFSQTHGHNFVVSTGSANLSNDSSAEPAGGKRSIPMWATHTKAAGRPMFCTYGFTSISRTWPRSQRAPKCRIRTITRIIGRARAAIPSRTSSQARAGIQR